MKNKILICLAALFVLAIGGCSTDDTGGSRVTGKYAAEFRGEWIRMDTGERWYISGNSISVNGTETAMNVTLQKKSENVVAVSGTNACTLFAARIANASFNAQVVMLDDSSRSTSSRDAIGGSGQRPPVKIVNPKQPDLDPLVVQPDANGEISVSYRIPGDRIEIVPQSSEYGGKVELTPGFGDDQDMGVIPITNGDNFKVTLVSEPSIDYYADGVPREYVFELENIGTTNCGDSGWELSWDSNDFYRSDGYGIVKADFANIKPGDKKQLKVTLGSNPIDTEVKNKKIKVSIWNYDSKTKKTRDWEDTVSINYYSAPVPFRLRSEKQVQGVIKAKNGKSYYFKTERQGEAGDFTTTVNVPWSLSEYTIAFLGASIESGSATKYSFAVDDQPPADWGSLRPIDFLRKYKPDNEYETTAPVLDLAVDEKTFMGYLAGDSIDYYKVKLNREMPESAKIIDLEDFAFKDQGVSVDGKANPGETLFFDFKFKNVSLSNKTVYINSLTADTYVQDNYGGGYVTLQPGYYGAIGSGTTSLVSSEVTLLNGSDDWKYRKIKLASNCPEGPLQLTLKFMDNLGLQYEKKITIQVSLSENLTAPTNLKADYPSEGSVRVTWDKVTGAEGYHAYFNDELFNLDSNTAYYERSGLESGTIYSFKVCAVLNGKEQGFSTFNVLTSGSVLVFNRTNSFQQNQFYQQDISSWEIMNNYYIRLYVAKDASYTITTTRLALGIRYEDSSFTDENEYDVHTSHTGGVASQTWVATKTGWARIKFLEIYGDDTFSFSITHPEQAVSAFSVNGINGKILEATKTIELIVPASMNLSNITPVVTAASDWTCETIGAKDFTNAVEYIFSKGNVRQAYTVSVKRE